MWMKVTRDKYELPVAVAETVYELADMLGVTVNSIYSSMYHFRKGNTKSTPYRKVEEGEDDAETDIFVRGGADKTHSNDKIRVTSNEARSG